MNATRALAVFAVLAAGSAAARAQATLKVGDLAPPIAVAKWVKGTPAPKKLALGKVYVVEFWATWCPPCRVTIPHLTKLQKQYGNTVSFNSIAVWQNEAKNAYIPAVEAFVKKMGDQMVYTVGVDTEPKGGKMAKTWMEAAGQNGIPTAFVIGKDNRIAYIGHPMDPQMTKVLDEVLAGTFDAKSARAAAERRARLETVVAATMEKVKTAYQANKDGDAEAALADLVKEFPELKSVSLDTRYERRISRGDEAGAFALMRSEWAETITDPGELNQLAWDIVTNERLKTPDYPLAVSLAQKAVSLTMEKDASLVDTLAFALYKSGQRDEAIAWGTKAVALAPNDKELADRLAMYKKG